MYLKLHYLVFIAFHRTANLRDILVKAKLPASVNNTTPLPPGSYRCGKNCITCPYIINDSTTYIFTSTGETRTITSHFTCDAKSVIYIIQRKIVTAVNVNTLVKLNVSC